MSRSNSPSAPQRLASLPPLAPSDSIRRREVSFRNASRLQFDEEGARGLVTGSAASQSLYSMSGMSEGGVTSTMTTQSSASVYSSAFSSFELVAHSSARAGDGSGPAHSTQPSQPPPQTFPFPAAAFGSVRSRQRLLESIAQQPSEERAVSPPKPPTTEMDAFPNPRQRQVMAHNAPRHPSIPGGDEYTLPHPLVVSSPPESARAVPLRPSPPSQRVVPVPATADTTPLPGSSTASGGSLQQSLISSVNTDGSAPILLASTASAERFTSVGSTSTGSGSAPGAAAGAAASSPPHIMWPPLALASPSHSIILSSSTGAAHESSSMASTSDRKPSAFWAQEDSFLSSDTGSAIIPRGHHAWIGDGAMLGSDAATPDPPPCEPSATEPPIDAALGESAWGEWRTTSVALQTLPLRRSEDWVCPSTAETVAAMRTRLHLPPLPHRH